MEGLQAEVRGARQTRQPVRLVARAAASILPGLLESFHKTQPDIAVSVGYENISYFHRLFQKTYGMSPRAYRMQSQGKMTQQIAAEVTES